MADDPKYRIPPIIEAVIEFRFANPIDFGKINKIANKVADKGDHVTDELHVDVRVDADNPALSRVIQRPVGKRIIAKDQTRTFTINEKISAVLVAPPYPGWSQMSRMALDLYDTHRALAGFMPLERIGVRYINRLDIPFEVFPEVRPDKVVNFYARLPEFEHALPETFTLQSTIRIYNPDAVVSLVTTRADSPVPDMWSILLDIDIGVEEKIPLRTAELAELFDKIQSAKNSIFEASITDAYREIIS